MCIILVFNLSKMDLTQRKLNKSEWESIEVPCSQQEKDVFSLIMHGYHNVNIRYNRENSLISFLKIKKTDEIEQYLFQTYLKPTIDKLGITLGSGVRSKSINKMTLKKIDMFRLGNNNIDKINKNSIFEYVLCDVLEKLITLKKKNKNDWMLEYFTIYRLIRLSVDNVNSYLLDILREFLKKHEDEINMNHIISNAVNIFEKTPILLKYEDMTLYEHQKNIFHIMPNPDFELNNSVFNHETKYDAEYHPPTPKLVLYIAPTGTGKTLTPIGLSERFKVIFICAARHVGLALAKCCISANKKVAFAFGCTSAEDIRLHYFAAKEYSIHTKSGGIGKVDNSVGDKVEIMICDVKSYLYAMYYMKAFNPVENMIVYWDEPTISMDYDNHDIHTDIHRNWTENVIPNVVLSSATLPKMHELTDTIDSFKEKFPNAEVHNITSYDCKKSIPIIDKNGMVVLPHHMSQDYEDIKQIATHCNNNLTLLRYFDLKEVVEFIMYVENNQFIPPQYSIQRCFESLDIVSMQNIKMHYLHILNKVKSGTWGAISVSLTANRARRIGKQSLGAGAGASGPSIELIRQSSIGYDSSSNVFGDNYIDGKPIIKSTNIKVGTGGMYISTKDAYTLTDGPTIFLSDEVEKVAKFCIQQANIPVRAMADIMEKIEYNNKVNIRINELEQKMETLEEKNNKKDDTKDSCGGVKGKKAGMKKESRHKNVTDSKDVNISKTNDEIMALRSMIKTAELNETFVPNKPLHRQKWVDEDINTSNAFTSNIDEEIITKIMMLSGIDDSWKILLLMGIGVFMSHDNITYTEIMKQLADQQKLYLIIASSDYIYGTNYQFCHGYLSKNMDLTQEKLIQSLGRIGRNNIQQSYSIRIRDDNQIKKIFYEEKDKMEVKMMNQLFAM